MGKGRHSRKIRVIYRKPKETAVETVTKNVANEVALLGPHKRNIRRRLVYFIGTACFCTASLFLAEHEIVVRLISAKLLEFVAVVLAEEMFS